MNECDFVHLHILAVTFENCEVYSRQVFAF